MNGASDFNSPSLCPGSIDNLGTFADSMIADREDYYDLVLLCVGAWLPLYDRPTLRWLDSLDTSSAEFCCTVLKITVVNFELEMTVNDEVAIQHLALDAITSLSSTQDGMITTWSLLTILLQSVLHNGWTRDALFWLHLADDAVEFCKADLSEYTRLKSIIWIWRLMLKYCGSFPQDIQVGECPDLDAWNDHMGNEYAALNVS